MLVRSSNRRRWWSAAAIAAAALLVPATTATAAPPSSGYWSVDRGPRAGASVSSGGASWDAASRTVTVRTVAYGLKAGTCQTAYFDWATPSSHHDLRGARTCRSGSGARNNWTETVPVTGVKKLRVCTGPQDRMGSCTVYPGAGAGLMADWSGSRGRTCAAWVLVSATGAVAVNSGGDPRRCDA